MTEQVQHPVIQFDDLTEEKLRQEKVTRSNDKILGSQSPAVEPVIASTEVTEKPQLEDVPLSTEVIGDKVGEEKKQLESSTAYKLGRELSGKSFFYAIGRLVSSAMGRQR